VDSDDLELIAQELSVIGERVSRLESTIAAVLARMGHVERYTGTDHRKQGLTSAGG
jgi:hypothetical protein